MKKILFVVIGVLLISMSYFVMSLTGEATETTTGEFTVGNEAPTITSFAVQESDGSWDSTTLDTHDDETSIRWTVDDNNPDALTTTVCIGTAPSLCDVVNYDLAPSAAGGEAQSYTYGTDPVGTGTTDTINFDSSDCSLDPCTKTYYVDIITTDSQEIITSSNSFQLTDSLPTFVDVQLSDIIGGLETCTLAPAQHCFVTPLSGDYTSVEAKLIIDDTDDDCDTAVSATMVLCLVDSTGAEVCDTLTNADYTYSLSSVVKAGTQCALSFSVANGDSANGIPFFQAPGTYKMYIISSSQAGVSASFPTAQAWAYSSLRGVVYGSSVTLGDATIELGKWNPGTTPATITNQGNLVLAFIWNATDASIDGAESCSSNTDTCWDMSTGGLQVDDDNSCSVALGEYCIEAVETGLSAADLQESPVQQAFGSLQICDVFACDSGIGETLDTYFHIQPPIGLSPGIYKTQIKWEY